MQHNTCLCGGRCGWSCRRLWKVARAFLTHAKKHAHVHTQTCHSAVLQCKVAALGVPYVLMHMRGDPTTMASPPHTLYACVWREVGLELQAALDRAVQAGIPAWSILLDPVVLHPEGAGMIAAVLVIHIMCLALLFKLNVPSLPSGLCPTPRTAKLFPHASCEESRMLAVISVSLPWSWVAKPSQIFTATGAAPVQGAAGATGASACGSAAGTGAAASGAWACGGLVAEITTVDQVRQRISLPRSPWVVRPSGGSVAELTQ
eukprot:scaffold145812_cov17-Tisochrysis_lutea.AAC.1